MTERSTGIGSRLVAALESDTIGGALLLLAALIGILWANSPAVASYNALSNVSFGPGALGLNLSLAQWASDGLLAIFFFSVGMELKREFTVGDLKHPAAAMMPIIAAACGVIMPALIYTAVVLIQGDASLLRGWAIPTATDIAFATAVLAVVNTHLPSSARTFLLTLAVVDDLIGIVIIAIFYATELSLLYLVFAAACLVAFAFVVRSGLPKPLRVALATVLGITMWVFMHRSGVHATIAGVMLGLSIPHVMTPEIDRVIGPISAGLVVPIFAFFSAGVRFVGGGFLDALADPAAQGVALALIFGKPIGIVGGTWLLTRLTPARLRNIEWADMVGIGVVAGVGFTVALLVNHLSFGQGSANGDHAKMAILTASTVSAIAGAILLGIRNRHYRRLALEASNR